MFIGLTGSIGSGKTTVADILEQEYDCFASINADSIVSGILADKKINKILKSIYVDYDWDNYKRKSFADYIFNNGHAEELSKILNPFIFYEIGIEASEALNSGLIPVFDIPLLFETYFNLFMDINIVVAVNDEERFNRLMNRGFSEEESKQRLSLQMPQEQKIKLADYTIDNSYDIQNTILQIKNFVNILENYDWDESLIKDALKRKINI